MNALRVFKHLSGFSYYNNGCPSDILTLLFNDEASLSGAERGFLKYIQPLIVMQKNTV